MILRLLNLDMCRSRFDNIKDLSLNDKIMEGNKVEALCIKILASKKYSHIDPKVVKRIVEDCIIRFGSKKAEKEAKKLLHQVWKLFLLDERSLNFPKLIEEFKSYDKDWTLIQISQLLKYYSSTRERAREVKQIYDFIFSQLPPISSIIDIGCGLHPLQFVLQSDFESFLSHYIATDIDVEEIRFLNTVFEKLSLTNFSAVVKDACQDNFSNVDLTIMFKLLPVLEMQKKNSAKNYYKIFHRSISLLVIR